MSQADREIAERGSILRAGRTRSSLAGEDSHSVRPGPGTSSSPATEATAEGRARGRRPVRTRSSATADAQANIELQPRASGTAETPADVNTEGVTGNPPTDNATARRQRTARGGAERVTRPDRRPDNDGSAEIPIIVPSDVDMDRPTSSAPSDDNSRNRQGGPRETRGTTRQESGRGGARQGRDGESDWDDGDDFATTGANFDDDYGHSDDGQATRNGSLEQRNGRLYFDFQEPGTGRNVKARVECKVGSSTIVFSMRPAAGYTGRPAYAYSMRAIGFQADNRIPHMERMTAANLSNLASRGPLGIQFVAPLFPQKEPVQRHTTTYIKLAGQNGWIIRSDWIRLPGSGGDGQINAHYANTGQRRPAVPLSLQERQRLQSVGQAVESGASTGTGSRPADNTRSRAAASARRPETSTPNGAAHRSETNPRPPDNTRSQAAYSTRRTQTSTPNGATSRNQQQEPGTRGNSTATNEQQDSGTSISREATNQNRPSHPRSDEVSANSQL